MIAGTGRTRASDATAYFASIGLLLVDGDRVRCRLRQHRTVAAIAAQAGASRPTVLAAMDRHGITPVPHAVSRRRAAAHGRVVAAPFRFTSLAACVAHRRGQGATRRPLAVENGIPESTMRRHTTRGDRPQSGAA
ncbi:hypothetical protein GCM10010399_84550 [Dactylosporangium fulvum]|uniref:Uncharacterized protein n=1 Tax=Dactylosporangium fulvum TaxID=53359 RepID=A0ABY5VQD2_9ACTN|nr:hypothetical protein [Dactylosporangium fulvum]UWP79983.1 hypothetical protein Dfulv_33115 [Dactylosporangium fulvum]